MSRLSKLFRKMASVRSRIQVLSKFDKLNLSDEVRTRSPLAKKVYDKSLKNYQDIIRTQVQPWSETDINEFAKLLLGDLLFMAKANGPDGNLIAIEVRDSAVTIPAVAAEFDGQVAGMTTDVQIVADTEGVDGNSVILSFDGLADIDDAILAWNTANPANTVSLASGVGSQIPDDQEEIQLADGQDAISSEVSAQVSNKVIIINIEEGVSTNQDVIDAVEASNVASALVSVELEGINSDPASSSSIQFLKDGK